MTGVSNSLQEETIALDCMRRYCTKGAGGAKWKTPVLTQRLAFEQLKLHMVKYHGYRDTEAARDNRSEKVEDNATRVRSVTVTGVDENGRLTVQLPDVPMWMFTNMGLTYTRATIYLPVGALVWLLME